MFNRQMSWDGVIAMIGIIFGIVPILVGGGIIYGKLTSKIDQQQEQITTVMGIIVGIQKTQAETSQWMAMRDQQAADQKEFMSRKSYAAPRQQDNP